MQVDFSPNTPIYLQIMHEIRQKIVSGQWPPGMRIPPVRELSVEFGVNPNTAQRSLAELEREELVHTERTTGRFITRDADLIRSVQNKMAAQYISEFLQQMKALGFGKEQILQQISSAGWEGEPS